MIDIHSHILPGLDDGPMHISECLEAAVRYLQVGIDCVIATPHYIPGSRWTASSERVMEIMGQTQQALIDADLPLQLLPGMEIALSDGLCHSFADHHLLTLGQQGFFLIEFPIHSSLLAPAQSSIDRLLNGNDYRFVIGHPERCVIFQQNRDLLEKFVASGLLVQVNIGSVLGLYGKNVRDTAYNFLASGLVHFLATDCHAGSGRLPPYPEEMANLADLLGWEAVQLAMAENPRRMLAGKPVFPLSISPQSGLQKNIFSASERIGQRIMRLFK